MSCCSFSQRWGGGGYAYYVWNESDKLLEQALLDRFHEIAPDWNLSFQRARFDMQGRIHVYELSLKESDGTSPLLDIAEAILTVDRERLADPETPMRQVRWRGARLRIIREADGTFNWQKLTPPKLAKNALPEMHVERAALSLIFRHAAPQPEDLLAFENINLQLIPAGARQFLVKASAKVSGADALSAEGTWQIDEGAWNLAGKIKNLTLDSSLSKLTANVSAEFRAGLSRLDTLLTSASGASVPADLGAGPAVDSTMSRATGPAPDPIGRLGLKAAADVKFRVQQWQQRTEREYNVSIDILRGELANPPLQFPLTNLAGHIELENQQIRLHELSAQSGPTRIKLEQGRVFDQGELRPAEFDLTVTGLSLDERVSSMLPAGLRKIYDELGAAGEVDLATHLEYNGRDRWDHDCDMQIRNCTATHERFPYRVEQIEGTLKKRGQQIDIAVQGRAGFQKVAFTGQVKNPGPEAWSRFVIKAAGIPIDDRLRRACPPSVQKVIDQLQAQGDVAGNVTLERPAGLGQELTIFVDARLSDGSINCQAFPYPLSSVSGEFRGQGMTWEFQKFRGRHEGAEVALSGNFRPNDSGRLRLKLDFSLAGAAFDRQLLAALPDEAQNIWKKFSPEGGLSVGGRLYWWPNPESFKPGNLNPPRPNSPRPNSSGPHSSSPGIEGRVQITKLKAELIDAKLTLSSFPFAVSDVAAVLDYDGKQAHIISFAGKHEETVIRIDGGLIEYLDDGEWRVRLEPFFVDDLEAAAQFRRALPKFLHKTVDSLDPRGKQSISGMVEFRGRRDEDCPVTAAWDTETVYSGSTLNAGVDLCDLHGKSFFRGTWDGEQATGEGRIKLNSGKIFKYQVTDIEGPFSLTGSRLILGSNLSPDRRGPADPDPARHISAHFIDGLVVLDAVVELGEPMRYGVSMTLKNGNLKRFAHLYMKSNHQRLAGTMNGSISFKGVGTSPRNLEGSGNLVISPAALYELPVIVQVFNVLSFIPTDKAAFQQALFAFSIGGGVVHFDRINLVGDSINLVGRGTVNMDTTVRLSFWSRMGRRYLPIPIVREIISEATKGAVGVEVSGTLDAPKSEVRSLPQMDDALRRLFDNRGAQRR